LAFFETVLLLLAAALIASTAKTAVSRSGLSRLRASLYCAIGLLVTQLAVAAIGVRAMELDKIRDFTGFYIGARLLGTDRIYDVPANVAMQRTLTGRTKDDVVFVRPPFWAAAIKPLTALPYRKALLLWKLLIIGCTLSFIWLFPLCPRRYTAIGVFWSLPVALAVAIAQDTPLILLWLALALMAWRCGRPMLCGALLALCLPKFYALVMLPLLLFQRRYFKVLTGFATVGLVAVAINFAVQPNWIRLYWAALNLPARHMNGRPSMMPNFYSLFAWTGHPGTGVVIGVAVVMVALWPICRKASFELALTSCLLGGVFASYHANDSDAILAIPALLGAAAQYRQLVPWAAVALSPVAFAGFLFYWPSIAAPMFLLPCLAIIVFVGIQHVVGDKGHDKRREPIGAIGESG